MLLKNKRKKYYIKHLGLWLRCDKNTFNTFKGIKRVV